MFSAACAMIFVRQLNYSILPQRDKCYRSNALAILRNAAKKMEFRSIYRRSESIISSINYCLISQSYQTTSRDSFAFIMGSRILKAEGKTIIRRLFQHRYMYICCSLSCSPFNFKSSCFAIMALTINVTHCIQRCQLSRNLIATSYLN